MHRRRFHSVRSAVVIAACLGLFAALSACSKDPEPLPTTKTVAYTVRAEIVSLPEPGKPSSEFMARHEEIPEFLHSLNSDKRGMRAMTMPFPLAPSISLDGLKPGAKVQITFEVDYALDTGLLIDSRATRVIPIGQDTVLDFAPRNAP